MCLERARRHPSRARHGWVRTGIGLVIAGRGRRFVVPLWWSLDIFNQRVYVDLGVCAHTLRGYTMHGLQLGAFFDKKFRETMEERTTCVLGPRFGLNGFFLTVGGVALLAGGGILGRPYSERVRLLQCC